MKQGVARRSLLVRGARLVVGTVALSLPGFARGMFCGRSRRPHQPADVRKSRGDLLQRDAAVLLRD